MKKRIYIRFTVIEIVAVVFIVRLEFNREA